jgi:hypothetical protein
MRELQKRKAETGGMRAAGAVNSNSQVPNASARGSKPQTAGAETQRGFLQATQRPCYPAFSCEAVCYAWPTTAFECYWSQEDSTRSSIQDTTTRLLATTTTAAEIRAYCSSSLHDTKSRWVASQESQTAGRQELPAIASVHIGRRAAVVAGTSRRWM